MLTKIILYSVLISTPISCASAAYKTVHIANEKMAWRICGQKDKVELFHKGLCFISKKCKRVFIKKKCVNVQYFCEWSDNKCFDKWELWNKKLISL